MMYPLMHDDLKVERELKFAQLERRRIAHEAADHDHDHVSHASRTTHQHRLPTLHRVHAPRLLPRPIATITVLLGALALALL
jgi:hypothetical protein